MIETLMNMDTSMIIWIQEHMRADWLNPVFILITTLGDGGMIWIIGSAALLISKKTRQVGIMCLVALTLSYLVNNLMLKNLVGRARPFEAISSIIPLIPRPADSSFPSGHSAASFASAWLMFRKLPKKFGIPALVLAVLIAFSRLYIGVHYPSDVIAGILSGIMLGYLAEMILNLKGHYKS
ncbi:MAG: phosphatase PAP2 family protein [bacterium]|nr:phosphatase PAP2 family protein [bacterium]